MRSDISKALGGIENSNSAQGIGADEGARGTRVNPENGSYGGTEQFAGEGTSAITVGSVDAATAPADGPDSRWYWL